MNQRLPDHISDAVQGGSLCPSMDPALSGTSRVFLVCKLNQLSLVLAGSAAFACGLSLTASQNC